MSPPQSWIGYSNYLSESFPFLQRVPDQKGYLWADCGFSGPHPRFSHYAPLSLQCLYTLSEYMSIPLEGEDFSEAALHWIELTTFEEKIHIVVVPTSNFPSRSVYGYFYIISDQ